MPRAYFDSVDVARGARAELEYLRVGADEAPRAPIIFSLRFGIRISR